MIGRKRKRLGDLLVDAGVVTEEQLAEALKQQRELGLRLGETLIELKFTDENEITEALHRQMGFPIAKIREAKLSPEVIALLPENIVRKHSVIPFELDEDNPNILRVAMLDPLDILAIDDLSIVTNMQIEVMVATPSDIHFAIERYYGNEQVAKMAESYSEERKKQQLAREKAQDEGNDEVDNAPIVLLVNKIIEQAVNERASDIHIEALEDGVRVRFRIDGVLQEMMRYEVELLNAIVARIKIISGMNISEKRAPQDGRMTQVFNRVEYDIRVSSLPTVFGEKVVMRLASKSALTRDKSELGFPEEELRRFEALVKNPHGIILVTGPTGSGKSTTLYTVLSELNSGDVNIITVEDPVEADVDGINQVQVNEKAGLTFASALRSILRQDPDIIMIGEIRDEETAAIAVKAAITGHLVVSTLHTNSAASTITRLEDMGVEPYLIADSTVGIIAQRLVRRLCPKCKKQHPLTEEDKVRLRLRGGASPIIYEPGGTGCAFCNGTGYRGRIGVYEIMPVSPAVRQVVAAGKGAEEIQRKALEEGMTTLRVGAAKLVLSGVTSISEVERIATE
ncbi:MAG: Flp pilus assembly complex ATPase component TadA [Lachnospiraceae bacterium]|nr:Flp pilus assembly complex ATPase component TadA [Lachnospiraceae bacterium]